MPPEQMALLIPLMGIGCGIVAIIAGHIQTMEKIRLKAKSEMNEAVRTELDQLRAEMQALRDTSTKFDISFDAALGSVEQRLERVEQRQAGSGYTTTTGTEEQQRAGLR